MAGVAEWAEVGDGVFVRRHLSFDLNVGLILGGQRCLVVDTCATGAEGIDLAQAVRRVTDLPWTVVNTHGHFDHFFGNAAFTPADVWAHAAGLEAMQCAASEYEQTATVLPNRTFDSEQVELYLGDRMIALRFLGRGHTDHDVIVDVGSVVFAGDLVEEGAPPAFEDAFPLEWPGTVDRLLQLDASIFVPGHGATVGRGFVRTQHAELEQVADAARRVMAGASAEEVSTPYPGDVSRIAFGRALAQSN
jgi:glyoxylase-like metal-dependent hydrolase (beta-lactamase superfamily II)